MAHKNRAAYLRLRPPHKQSSYFSSSAWPSVNSGVQRLPVLRHPPPLSPDRPRQTGHPVALDRAARSSRGRNAQPAQTPFRGGRRPRASPPLATREAFRGSELRRKQPNEASCEWRSGGPAPHSGPVPCGGRFQRRSLLRLAIPYLRGPFPATNRLSEWVPAATIERNP
jgi:hypothetical protein